MTTLDHYWRAIDMPRRYWAVQTKLPSVMRVTPNANAKAVVSVKEQDAVLDDLMRVDLRAKNPVRIIISSTPKDDAAMTIATSIVKAALTRQPYQVNGVAFLNTASTDVMSPRLKDINFAILYNVTVDSPRSRFCVVRDFLSMFEIPTIVVVCGTNPIDFAEQHLRIDIDYALYFRDTTHCVAANAVKSISKVQTI